MAEHLDRLQRLTERRNLLLHLAADDPRPCVARALRCNRQLAEAARRAARQVRAQLAELEAMCAAASGSAGGRSAADESLNGRS